MFTPRGGRIKFLLAAPKIIVFMRSILLCFAVISLANLAKATDPASAATDFEWELQTPNRILYRDRVTVGQIALTSATVGKKAAKATGESVVLIVEMAYVPGDSAARYFGISLELQNSGVQAGAILDDVEIPSLYRMMDYALKTAQDIEATERGDTRFQYRSKSGFALGFEQRGKAQQFSVRFPQRDPYPEATRWLTREQLSTLRDLLDLAVFELKRQGATIVMAKK